MFLLLADEAPVRALFNLLGKVFHLAIYCGHPYGLLLLFLLVYKLVDHIDSALSLVKKKHFNVILRDIFKGLSKNIDLVLLILNVTASGC